jgi:hypothetical protein
MRFVNRRLAVLPLLLLLGLTAAACSSSAAAPTAAPASQAGAIPAPVDPGGKDLGVTGQAATTAAPATAAPAVGATTAPESAAQTLVVKTGQLVLQVSNAEGSANQVNGIVTSAGGYVASSSRSGDTDTLTISATYRIPVAKWDATIAAIHNANGGGTLKILSEQIQTDDVTASAVDMDAHLTNLRATEQALLSIMARATTIADTLAVQSQLTTVRGEIEGLQAKRNTLGDQAAFSTLTVQFMATGKTQTTTAASGWTINSTIDDATATLVKLGQSLASLTAWLIIVGLPVVLGLLILFAVYRLARRIWRRPAEPRETAQS